MQRASALVFGLAGLGLGVLMSLMGFQPTQSARAGASDRYQDYVMCTGAVYINPKLQTDGVWLLDYRSGKLLGTVIDKSQGKIVGWAEVDLAAEFSVQPKEDVHFIMTTGYILQGQSALYVAETTTGKFGVYTMGPGTSGSGIAIRRHDMTNFRMVQPAVQPTAASIPGMPGVPATPLQGTPYPQQPGMMPAVPTPGMQPGMGVPPAPLPNTPGMGIPVPTAPQVPQYPPATQPPSQYPPAQPQQYPSQYPPAYPQNGPPPVVPQVNR